MLSGGSLEMWKKYFHPESRIIGIDLNPKCKKFETNGIEIFIGDQSDENFWNNFYKKIGKIDILLDDGGHTNMQQIITTIKSVQNINDGGILMVEDTHASYMHEFANPSKHSFINFTKKLIDDVNFKFPGLGKFKVSLNDYIYSIQYYESLVVFHINTKKTSFNNKIILNEGRGDTDIVDLRYKKTFVEKLLNIKIKSKFIFLKKNRFARKIYFFLYKTICFFQNRYDIKKYKKKFE